MAKKTLSRRAVLKGAGGIMISLPFLEAMLPRLATAATATPRLVILYGGTPSFIKTLPTVGALGAITDPGFMALESVRQYVSLVSGLALPLYSSGQTPPPGGGIKRQHHVVQAPFLGGMPSMDAKPVLNQCHTVDQVFADLAGGNTRFKSIQARVQAGGYGYGDNGGIISSRYTNGVLSTLSPVVSPLELFTKLFSGGVGTTTTTTTTVNQQLVNRRSVLDLVLGDANRLTNSLSGQDKIKLEQHFEGIRDIERRLSPSTTTTTTTTAACVVPNTPTDPPLGNLGQFGSWSDETTRGDLQADILALALACDLTRSISWQLTYDQCGLGSLNIGGVNADLHKISHDVNNDNTLKPAMQAHLNWHCARFARLISKLASLDDGNGKLIDQTFLSLGFGEGQSAHNRTHLHYFVAGNPSGIKLGQHIPGNGEHPAKIWIAGLNSLGLSFNQLGQISGAMGSILK